MRKIYDTDIKTRLTTVTEYQLTRSGVKKSNYATDYSNTNLVELDESSASIMSESIGEPLENLANALKWSDTTSHKMVLCNGDESDQFIIDYGIIIDTLSILCTTPYSDGSEMNIMLRVGDEETLLESIELSSSQNAYDIDINYECVSASSENMFIITASVTGNTNEEAASLLHFTYREANGVLDDAGTAQLISDAKS